MLTTSDAASSSAPVDIGPFFIVKGDGAEGKPFFFMAKPPSPPRLFVAKCGNGCSPFFTPTSSPFPFSICSPDAGISILAFLASSASSAVMPSLIVAGKSSTFPSGFTSVCSLLSLILSASSAVAPSVISFVAEVLDLAPESAVCIVFGGESFVGKDFLKGSGGLASAVAPGNGDFDVLFAPSPFMAFEPIAVGALLTFEASPDF